MRKKLLLLFLILFTFAAFVWINTAQLDPDFGWHIKLGEYILKHGIPKTDPFSYTVPSYPFVDHEWLSNIIIYLIYQGLGYTGLAVLYAILVTLTPFVMLGKKSVSLGLAGVILLFTVFVSRTGVRPQLESWMLFGVLLKVLWDEQLWRKYRLFIPVLFLFWTNLHGSFVLGIVALGIFTVFRAMQSKKLDTKELYILFFSAGATLANPYGWRSWWEVYMLMTDPLLHRYILEWFPFYTHTDLGFVVLCGFIIGMLKALPKATIAVWKLVLTVVLFLGSLSAVRHIPLFALAGALLITDYMGLFRRKALTHPGGIGRYKTVYMLVICIAFTAYTITLIVRLKGSSYLSQSAYYPVGAVEYIKKHPTPGRLFSSYAWGGYLEWKLPGEKVFIDGRMPDFRNHTVTGESSWILKDYIDIMQGHRVPFLFHAFGVTRALIPNPRTAHPADLFTRLSVVLGFTYPVTRDAVLVNLLTEKGWVVCYSDPTSLLLHDKTTGCK